MKGPLLILLIAAALWASDTSAASTYKIKVNRSVPYLNDDVGTPEIRRECDWNRRVIDYLVQYSRGRVEIFDGDLDQAGGTTLHLVATGIHSIGGAVATGPKWAKIRGELKVDGKVINNFEVTSRSEFDPFRFSSCSVLNKIARQLGAYTARWIRNPGSVVSDTTEDSGNPQSAKDEPATDASAPAPPSSKDK